MEQLKQILQAEIDRNNKLNGLQNSKSEALQWVLVEIEKIESESV